MQFTMTAIFDNYVGERKNNDLENKGMIKLRVLCKQIYIYTFIYIYILV